MKKVKKKPKIKKEKKRKTCTYAEKIKVKNKETARSFARDGRDRARRNNAIRTKDRSLLREYSDKYRNELAVLYRSENSSSVRFYILFL